jgi:uncharacterized membrane protein
MAILYAILMIVLGLVTAFAFGAVAREMSGEDLESLDSVEDLVPRYVDAEGEAEAFARVVDVQRIGL